MNSQVPTPYIGPRTFLESESDRFFGRETEARDLLALVVSERLVVFYAQSGAGKSSLVNTCLIPDLRKRGYEIFTGRVVGDAPSGIQPENIYVFNLLRSLAAKERNAALLASQTINEFLKEHTGTNTLESNDESPSNILIIDQFEEIFSTHHEEWERREGFFNQLAQALEEDPYFSIVLVMREDFLASLDPYSPLIPNRFRRRYYMQRLEREAALEAVKKPVEKIRPYDDGVAERLVNDLSGIKIQKADETTETQPGQFVEGVQLQLVCFKLWKSLGSGDRITHADLDKLGDVNLALEEHYAERVHEVAELKKVSERLIREWFGKKLITPAGTRNMVLRSLRRVEGELPDHVIQALQSDLVRAEQRGASAFYELTHDRLVEPILANNKKWFDNLSPLQRQAALWNDQGRNDTWLFGDQALAEAEAWAKEHESELTLFEKEFLKASQKNQKEKVQKLQARQQRIITYISIAAFLVTTGLGVFGIQQAIEANAKSQEAQTASTLAYTIAETSQANALIARVSEAEAKKQSNISRAGELAAQAQRLIDEDLQTALLLGIESFRKSEIPPPQSRSALLNVTTANPQLLQFLAGHTDVISSVAYSPDGNILASGSYDDSIILWDVEKRQPISQLMGHTDDVSSVAFSPDGKILASGSGDNTIILWDVEKSQPIGEPLTGHTGYVSSVIFSPDGGTLASGSYDGTIVLWEVGTRQPIGQPLIGHESYVSSVVFSPDGKWLASGSGDGIIIQWDVSDPRAPFEFKVLVGINNYISSLAFSPDSNALASGNGDNTINLWDVESGKVIGQLTGHTSPVNTVSFNPDGTTLATGGYDNTIILWDVGTAQIIRQFAGSTMAISNVAFNPDGGSLVSGGYDGTLRVWAVEPRQPIGQSLTGHISGVSSVSFHPDENILASGSYDGTINLWDTETFQPVAQPLMGHTNSVLSIAFSPDGKILASGGYDNTIILWDVESRQPIDQPLIGHTNFVISLAFSPDGKSLASGSGDKSIIMWDVNTHQPIGQPLTRHKDSVLSIAFSPDGKTLVSTACGELRENECTQGEIIIWDVETRQPIGEPLTGHTSWITTLAISPDGTTLASAGYNNTIILWDLESRQPIGQLSGQASLINSIAFSPDGKTLASGSYDYTIILWDVETRQPIGEFTGHSDAVLSIAFSPDGETLASGSWDSTIILWDVSPDTWIAQSCQRAGRNFTRAEWDRYFPNEAESYRKTCDQWLLEPEPGASATPAGTDVHTTTPTSTPVVIRATATDTSFASPTATATLPIILFFTDTPRPTPTPAATATAQVLYRVINVVEGDVLNLRAGPGTKYDVLARIPFDARGIQITGDGVQVDNSLWLPVIYDGISGWVNSYWLAPDQEQKEK